MSTIKNKNQPLADNRVSFATSVYEKDWQHVLLGDRLKSMIDGCSYQFEDRMLVVNTNEVNSDLFSALSKQIKDSVIDQVLFSSVWSDFLLQHYKIERSSLEPGYNYLIQNLTAIHACTSDYLLWFTCDSQMSTDDAWIDDAITEMRNDEDIVVANPVWNNKFKAAEKASFEQLEKFYVSRGFSDQCCLLSVRRYRDDIYSFDHPKSACFPDYAGHSFERRVHSWMHTKKLKRITHKRVSYQHRNFARGEPENLFQQKKQEVSEWINYGLSFDNILTRVDEHFCNLLESKNFYHYCARNFAQCGDRSNTLKALKALIKKWPNGSVASQRVIDALDNGVVELNRLKFDLDPSVLSLHMQLVIARGDYEADELKMLCKYAKPKDRVLELGAGVGFVGINYLQQNPSHYYVACEANPHLIALIKKNQAHNNIYFNVENIIFDDYEGHVDFFITEDFWASSLVEPAEYKLKHRVGVKNINDYIESHDINTVIMDIEGAEFDLIKKIDLSRLDKVILEMHSNVYGVKGMNEIVEHLKFNGFALPPGKWKGGIIMMYNKSRFSLD